MGDPFFIHFGDDNCAEERFSNGNRDNFNKLSFPSEGDCNLVELVSLQPKSSCLRNGSVLFSSKFAPFLSECSL